MHTIFSYQRLIRIFFSICCLLTTTVAIATPTPDPGAYYSLSNSFLKEGVVLGVANGKLVMDKVSQSPDNKRLVWKFTPVNGNPGYFRITNVELGDGKSLDSSPTAPHMAASGNYSGQLWKLTDAGNGHVRLSNMYQPAKSLDTNGNAPHAPFLGDTGNYSGQFWKLTPTLVATTLKIDSTGTAQKGTQVGTFTVKFSNEGQLPVKLVKLNNSGMPLNVDPVIVEKDLPRPISIPGAKVGDIYKVYILDNKQEIDGRHNTVVISAPNETIVLSGNKTLEEQKLSFTDLNQVDAEANYAGVDIGEYTPSNVNASISKKPIFENLQIDDVDYHIQSKTVLKRGFNYTDTYLSIGSNKTRMVHGYKQFATALSVGVGATFPLGKLPATGSIDVAYKEKKEENWSTTDVFAFSKEQKSLYKVESDPVAARLSKEFIRRILASKTTTDMDNIRKDYGTHYPRVVFYGGEYLTYMRMTEKQYEKLESKGTDIKGSIETAKKGVKEGSLSKTTTSSKGGNGGSVAVSFGESSAQKDVSSKTELKYRSAGGIGGFDGWDIDSGSVVPVSVELEPLYTLITPEVFKSGVSATELKQKQALLKKVIDGYISKLPELAADAMPKRYYNVTLQEMSVTDHWDDLNQNTKGYVSILLEDKDIPLSKGGSEAYKYWGDEDNGIHSNKSASTNKITDKSFWKEDSYTLDFRNKPNFVKQIGRRVSIVVPANKRLVNNGKVTYQYPKIRALLVLNMYEKDDCCGDEHYREAIGFDLDDSKAEDFEIINLDAKSFTSFAEKGTIRAKFKVERMPFDFEDFSTGKL